MNFLSIPHDKGVRIAHYEEIVRVQGMSNYSKIYFNHGAPLVVAKVLHWFEQSLPGDLFIRIHKSHLINKSYVKEVGGLKCKELLLCNGEVIIMSRRKKLKLTA